MNREKLLEQLQIMITELPPKLQERFEKDNISDQLVTLLLDGNIFNIVNNLQESQARTEKNLSNERQKLIKKVKDQEADLIRKHSEDEARCADRPQHLNLLQAANKREFEAFIKRVADEQQRFDMSIVLDLDQKMLEQQTRLEKAGVPCMHATNKPLDVRLQMFIIEFIQRIAKQQRISPVTENSI
ncbi:unnamed protein product [Rotaria socialis]|uniref:Uncharacterized protein n=1 Tax=Rotaria socialis TaxID=392032 RepID=A0A817WY86_9BILA|nr:unnamed protein product [Rotaria socialis]CAF3366553.1 unnamed protein product [Rotaria socialis]CAF3369905.1 unnamed protein product [Rotaria socialis]CAF3424664.1 unnamed protein product [Rotaria socialis]CAF3720147.1 unnamed protein product [Rotaria socialis]